MLSKLPDILDRVTLKSNWSIPSVWLGRQAENRIRFWSINPSSDLYYELIDSKNRYFWVLRGS